MYYSSGSVAWKTLNLMMRERRVLIIIILLAIAFYIDNIVFYWAVNHVIFPCMILMALSFDLIVIYFPRRVSLAVMVFIMLVLLWNIYKPFF